MMNSTTEIGCLPDPYRSRLASMYQGDPQLGTDGQLHEIHKNTKISAAQARMLFEICLQRRPQKLIEIGLAYGYSTLAFLAAIDRLGSGHLTSIDPYQQKAWCGIGLQHAYSLCGGEGSAGGRFRFLEQRSDRAAMMLADLGESFDLVYIDGAHTFDYALVDFFLFEQICPLGGLIVFDDMWMKSIQAVTSFIRSNRKEFREIRTPVPNLCVFEKTGSDSRDWQHFEPFW